MNMDAAWISTLRRVYAHGTERSPRGQVTRELLADLIVVDMTRPVLTVVERKLGYRFLAAEAAWILSGDDRVETIAPYSKMIHQFSDDGIAFFGAYGTKILPQLPYVVETLQRDPQSRQAVINIWRESPPQSRDIPCTLSCQFLIRDDQLHAVVAMRSSDVWLGVPYDVFNFSMLAGYVLCELGSADLTLGNLYHFAGSRHLYERNWDGARDCLGNWFQAFEYKPFDAAFEYSANLVAHLWALAERNRDGLYGTWLTETLDLRRET